MENVEPKDVNGKILKAWDTVQPIKDLQVKWKWSKIFKRWESIKKIQLTDDPEYVSIKWWIYLKTEFLKKRK